MSFHAIPCSVLLENLKNTFPGKSQLLSCVASNIGAVAIISQENSKEYPWKAIVKVNSKNQDKVEQNPKGILLGGAPNQTMAIKIKNSPNILTAIKVSIVPRRDGRGGLPVE